MPSQSNSPETVCQDGALSRKLLYTSQIDFLRWLEAFKLLVTHEKYWANVQLAGDNFYCFWKLEWVVFELRGKATGAKLGEEDIGHEKGGKVSKGWKGISEVTYYIYFFSCRARVKSSTCDFG